MVKNFFLIILIILGVCLFSANDKAEAVTNWDFYTTDKDSSALKAEFAMHEQPYSYLFVNKEKFSSTPLEMDIKWTWLYNGQEEYLERYYHLPWDEFLDNNENFQIWETPSLWPDINESGLWETKVSWKALLSDGWTGYHNRSTSFTVTPEPVSSLLFVAGGASLAIFRYKRKKGL